ncbi:uncharacterized protein K441DRAFT_691598 [Cenococcum geophilum 1.58]|uniref:Uncharacterized protein n=1 Tax=Cenococcum geophilum 1.58 TaxID=794803 RepID=A0ACC8EK74_9PEZI|nr:hypothetical protein K441DRAFT_691598 [Cenococcum geophilum 1.58]
MASSQHLDPHEKPPDHIRNVYKKYQKMKLRDLDKDPDIIDFKRGLLEEQKRHIKVIKEYNPEELTAAFRAFEGIQEPTNSQGGLIDPPILVYEHSHMPGLHILPALLPPSTQLTLLSRLLHRDLSNPLHLTNLHTHYTLAYPSNPTSPSRPPNPLRWLTLGGQYDWTAKRYPTSPPPPFPPDIAALLTAVFADAEPQAAIVNLYSPGDTLSLHRDVAEGCRKGLSSVSLGCEGVFVVGPGDAEGEEREERDWEGAGKTVLALRLPSGSAVYMGGEARFAWHGVPQIVAGTCPAYLADWPAAGGGEGGDFEAWRGWMGGKRVNLNVRQMWD